MTAARIEPWLRAIGFAIWAFVGSSGSLTASWRAPWLAYGVAFAVASLHKRLPKGVNFALLAVQAVSVLVLPWLKRGGFEGLMLAIVVAQAPGVMSFRRAALWASVQALLLFATVLRFKTALEIVEILGAYSSFSVFALLVHELRLQEERARKELTETNAALVATQALLALGSRQAERLRISRELHDSLGHHLTALRLQLELAQRLVTGNAIEPLAKAQALARDALGEVRRVVSEMHEPASLDLVPALRALAGAITAPRIAIDARGDLGAIDREKAHAIFRCVQEGITNSVKHASAKNVSITLSRQSAALEVVIRDDGDGAREVSAGRGLASIRARAEQLGGNASFDTSPGRGFTIAITVPA